MSLLEHRTHRRLGWKAPLPDHRRPLYRHALPILTDASLPSLVDLRPKFPRPYDQGGLGGCTSSALAGAFQHLQRKSGVKDFVLSRLWHYYCERSIEGSVKEDAGASLADGVQVLERLGAPPESLWWYNETKFAVKPNKGVYDAALAHKVSNSLSLNNTNVNELRTVLATGFAFVGGITVYDSFMDDAVARSGVVPMPSKSESIQGGHAICFVGYDHDKRVFFVRNSWGVAWGMGGYFTLPYDYVTNADLANDFWSLHSLAA